MAEEKKDKQLTKEQELVVANKKKRLVVSASAGSGKTFVVVEKLIKLICEEKVPVSRLLVLTFTKAAASELKTRLYTEILNQPSSPFLIEQLDDIGLSDISTIDAFCEKVIKRNINKLSLAQNFAILDEKSGEKLKNSAFKRAFEKFSSENGEKFEEIYFAFKRNSELIEECVETLQAFFDSVKDGESLKENFSKNVLNYHQKACLDLKERIKNYFSKSKKVLNEALCEADILGEKLAQGHIQFVEGMETMLSADFSQDFFALCKDITARPMPALSTAKCEKSVREKLALAKDYALKAYEIATSQKYITDELIEKSENGSLSKNIMEFYDCYAQQYKSLKERRSALDFADLEKYAKILLEDDEVKKNLQERYDYIIIDEYQDTNRLQEAILKPIAEGGYFIAVGDIKQGIYGFRNASKEIMSEDIEEFEKSKDGEALFLRGNFRTDNRILEFVNKIFVKLMTTQSVGINYKKTSMLEGKNTFLPNSLPAVQVDIVCPPVKTPKEKEEEKKQKQKDEWKDVYSVKEDEIKAIYEYQEEITVIAHRIDEVLCQKIYSPKLKAFRQVEEGDIALLFRNRCALMQEVVSYLQSKGFSVSADIKENLLEDSQIALIHSLLKLTINPNDDIPLASVMASPFGGFTLEELAQIRRQDASASFYQIVKSSESEKIKIFFDRIAEFKFDISVFGIIKALERLFARVNYMDYLQNFEDRELKRQRINKLFALIRSKNLDFNPQEVISQLESAKKEDKAVTDGGNSITVTTIHATKGLEYPIVIICGGGESLTKVYNKNYIASQKYGLGSHLYSIEDNLRLPAPAFIAGKLEKREREFVDELMLFYVAMTRAQNHLYIIGSGKEKDFSFDDLSKQNTYLKLIFYALGENFTAQVFAQELVKSKNVTFAVITEAVDIKDIEENQTIPQEKVDKGDEEFQAKLQEFYDFDYPDKEVCKLSYKNSVTGATKLMLDEEYVVGETLFEQQESDLQESAQQKEAREKAVEIGNSYHEALKFVNFDNVENLEDLKKEFDLIKGSLQEGYAENIDLNLLLKNILIIKKVVGKNCVYKEREFIMECSPQEIGATVNSNNLSRQQTLIVQGIIDLFAVGEKLILVDYKYTSTKDENKLVTRYKAQLDLYEKALAKGFERKIDEKYLLSLKEAKLIKID